MPIVPSVRPVRRCLLLSSCSRQVPFRIRISLVLMSCPTDKNFWFGIYYLTGSTAEGSPLLHEHGVNVDPIVRTFAPSVRVPCSHSHLTQTDMMTLDPVSCRPRALLRFKFSVLITGGKDRKYATVSYQKSEIVIRVISVPPFNVEDHHGYLYYGYVCQCGSLRMRAGSWELLQARRTRIWQ